MVTSTVNTHIILLLKNILLVFFTFTTGTKAEFVLVQNEFLTTGTIFTEPGWLPPVDCVLPSFQKTSHPRIQNLSQKTSHPTLFRKCMRMQESLIAKYG